MLGLYGKPAEYSAAMKKLWTPEIPKGTFVEIRSPRKPEWLAENRDNPLMDWEGREHISSVRYRRSLAQYPAGRSREVAEVGPQVGRHRLIVDMWNAANIRRVVTDHFERSAPTTGMAFAANLARIGHWEFEDYVEYELRKRRR